MKCLHIVSLHFLCNIFVPRRKYMKAVYNISYGVYVLTAKEQKYNGCIINTLMQVTSSPCRISITINKDNYTTSIIDKTGEFNVSILDMTADFDIIKRFGFASGKNVDKFEGFKDFSLADNGIPYITKQTNAYLSARVISKLDVGTHITYVADVTGESVLSTIQPMTYAYYINNIKPKPESKKSRVYVCRICGYVYEGDELPSDFICPICKHGAEDFELVEDQSKKSVNKEQNKSEMTMYYCPICGHSEPINGSTGTCVLCGAKMIKK